MVSLFKQFISTLFNIIFSIGSILLNLSHGYRNLGIATDIYMYLDFISKLDLSVIDDKVNHYERFDK